MPTTTSEPKKDRKSNRYIKNLQYVNAPDTPEREVYMPSIDDVDKASEKQKLLRNPESVDEANSHTGIDFDQAISITHNIDALTHGLAYWLTQYFEATTQHHRNKVSSARAETKMQLDLLRYSVNKIARLIDCDD